MNGKRYIDPNIARVGEFVAQHLHGATSKPNVPPNLSSIEFSINAACNRRCVFCPRVDPEIFPNLGAHLDISVYRSLIDELVTENYSGRLSFSGFCEPLLTKNIEDYIRYARENLAGVPIDLNTNGDVLLAQNGLRKVISLFEAGLSHLSISMYDGPEKDELFIKLLEAAKLEPQQFKLRKRYLPPENSYGMTISNRAGAATIQDGPLNIGPLEEPLSRPCYYPFYKVLIDYDTSVLICSNDWLKKRVIGSIANESLMTIWRSAAFLEVRKKLAESNRCFSPCDKCDVDGTINGEEHFNAWRPWL